MNLLLISAAITVFILLALLIAQMNSSRRRLMQFHDAREELVRLETINQSLNEESSKLQSDITSLEDQLEKAQNQLHEAIRNEKLAQQKLEHEQQYRQQWEKDRAEFEKSAKASILTAGQQLSSKLLEDHRRESKEMKEAYSKEKQQENQKIREYLTQLNERFSNNEKLTEDTKRQNDILWRTFSSPSSTGQLAEVGLENLLKNMGLIPGSDFSMQYTVTTGTGAGLRPDCVIKLPNNRIVVIDCKASKHVLAVAEAKGTEQEAAENEKFLSTMKEHLKALSRKDYVNALQHEEFLTKKDIRPGQIINVMYLPSSAAVELLYTLDRDLIDKSEKQGTIIIGPGMLHGLLYLVSKEITDERKLENQERINHEIERLLTSLASTFGHISNVGNSIKKLTRDFSKISGSFNTQVSPKLRNLDALGIRPHGSKSIPQQLESYELRSMNETIDVTLSEDEDPADPSEPASLEDYRKQKASSS